MRPAVAAPRASLPRLGEEDQRGEHKGEGQGGLLRPGLLLHVHLQGRAAVVAPSSLRLGEELAVGGDAQPRVWTAGVHRQLPRRAATPEQHRGAVVGLGYRREDLPAAAADAQPDGRRAGGVAFVGLRARQEEPVVFGVGVLHHELQPDPRVPRPAPLRAHEHRAEGPGSFWRGRDVDEHGATLVAGDARVWHHVGAPDARQPLLWLPHRLPCSGLRGPQAQQARRSGRRRRRPAPGPAPGPGDRGRLRRARARRAVGLLRRQGVDRLLGTAWPPAEPVDEPGDVDHEGQRDQGHPAAQLDGGVAGPARPQGRGCQGVTHQLLFG
mmetsp:Transcript_101485/g.275832  ORF Transcript_101485/g.275832 Transcript_101485/m.275832 type:complete len:325 (+) Transcript_101485:99-1073(+)